MIWILLAGLVCAAALLLFSALDTLCQERGKIVERELQRGVDYFTATIEPRLGGARESAPVGALLWVQLATAGLGASLLAWTILYTPETPGDWIEALLLLLLAVVGCRLAVENAIRRARLGWMRAAVPPMRLALYLVLPLSLLADLGGRLAGLATPHAPPDPEAQRESDIEALVEAGEEEGIIEADERELVQSALEFGDKRLREIMVPRPDIMALPASATFLELFELARKFPFQRVPVYEHDLDHVIGVVAARELLRMPESEWGRHPVGAHLHSVLFIPESATSFDLLRLMQRRRIHVAIVVNEYGAVAGLVTVSDLLEEIVGELPPETSAAAPEMGAPAGGKYLIQGSLDLDRLEDLTGIRFEHREASTLGGLLIEHLGHIPQAGEHVRLNGMDFEVLEANPVRVLKVRATPEAAEAHPSEQAP